MSFYGFRPYVPVATRRARAERERQRLAKKGGRIASPVVIDGRTIAHTFWGKAWCDNLERYSDYENRLPRGRSYLRNGLVVDLSIAPGVVKALVSGSSLYQVEVKIGALEAARWRGITKECAGQIGTVIELLKGRFSSAVMALLVRPDKGLFPSPKEIVLSCSCPDWAEMCKHVAAVLYGVGARLDEQPELFFALRQVDSLDLVAAAGDSSSLAAPVAAKKKLAAGADLSRLFGIDLDAAAPAAQRLSRNPGPSQPPEARAARGARRERAEARDRRSDDAMRSGSGGPGDGREFCSASRATKLTAPAPALAAKVARRPAAPPPVAAPKPQKRARTPATISAADLLAAGIPRTTFQNWVTQGILERTDQRGVYRRTPMLAARLAAFEEPAGKSKAPAYWTLR